MVQNSFRHNIIYSCISEAIREHEPFVRDHILSYVISGEVYFHTDKGTKVYKQGSLGIVKKNQLVNAVKKPAFDKPFMSISVLLSQEALKKYSDKYGVKAIGTYTGESTIPLQEDAFMKSYFDSLLLYFEFPEQLTETLAEVKITEAIELLLRNPLLKNLLFDFSEPFKIDIEEYMNRNFTFNIPLEDFAKLTGRSISTFKRDFYKIFHTTPGQWLQKRRLEQAHYLIAEKNERPSDVYLNVGFESISHFSTSFKKFFGYSPKNFQKQK